METTKTASALGFSLLLFYRSQFWRLQKLFDCPVTFRIGFIGHNFGDYKNLRESHKKQPRVLSVTILETTKTLAGKCQICPLFYRSQFWRLQKLVIMSTPLKVRFIGHNFGDYKNLSSFRVLLLAVLSVTILETTKTAVQIHLSKVEFYRSQFWRLQKPFVEDPDAELGFIGHNFGDYKNCPLSLIFKPTVLSVTILETTKTNSQTS